MEELHLKACELAPLERKVFEEMVKRNPGMTLDQICKGCNRCSIMQNFP